MKKKMKKLFLTNYYFCNKSKIPNSVTHCNMSLHWRDHVNHIQIIRRVIPIRQARRQPPRQSPNIGFHHLPPPSSTRFLHGMKVKNMRDFTRVTAKTSSVHHESRLSSFLPLPKCLKWYL